jgi:hypothetical protein
MPGLEEVENLYCEGLSHQRFKASAQSRIEICLGFLRQFLADPGEQRKRGTSSAQRIGKKMVNERVQPCTAYAASLYHSPIVACGPSLTARGRNGKSVTELRPRGSDTTRAGVRVTLPLRSRFGYEINDMLN